MINLNDLTMNQLATAFGALTGIPTTPKAWNTKGKGISRVETLMTEKGLGIDDVFRAAGQPTTATLMVEPMDIDAISEPVIEVPATETAEPLDAADFLASERVAAEGWSLIYRFLTDAGLDSENASNAAARAVKALLLPGTSLTAPRPRTDTKQAMLIDMLRQPEGATISELAQALDWQTHSVRGLIAAGLKKKLGLTVVSEKTGNGARTYHIPATIQDEAA